MHFCCVKKVIHLLGKFCSVVFSHSCLGRGHALVDDVEGEGTGAAVVPSDGGVAYHFSGVYHGGVNDEAEVHGIGIESGDVEGEVFAPPVAYGFGGAVLITELENVILNGKVIRYAKVAVGQ